MTTKPRARTALVVAAVLAVAACDEKPVSPGHGVRPLVTPTAAEREASEKIVEANALLSAGGDKEAEPLLRRALELSPRDARALKLLSKILVDRRAHAEAASLLRRLVEVAPEDFAARQDLFDALEAQRDFAAAAAVAEDWAKASGGSCDAWYALGCASHDLGKLDAAAKALGKAVDAKASRADVRSRLGLVYLDQGKRPAAEVAQRDALQRDPSCHEAWFRLGDVIERAGPTRYEEAIAAYRRAAEDPAKFGFVRARIYRLLALAARANATKLADAETEWKALLRLVGREMLPWNGLGAPSLAVDAAKEEKALRAAVLAKPDDAQARLRFAMFLHRQGDFERAMPEYVEAERADPKSARIASALGAARLLAGDASAEPTLARASQLDPTDPTTWRNLGWARMLAGRDAEAVEALEQTLKLHGADRLAQRARGLAKMHAGDLDGGMRDVVESGWTGR